MNFLPHSFTPRPWMKVCHMLFAQRLLVMDDAPHFAEVVEHVGIGLGYEVSCVHNSRDFRARFTETLPLTVVLDVIIPDEDGVELMRWLNQSPYRPRIVLVTGYNKLYLDWVKDLAASGGANIIATLTKPVSLSDLRDALQMSTALTGSPAA